LISTNVIVWLFSECLWSICFELKIKSNQSLAYQLTSCIIGYYLTTEA